VPFLGPPIEQTPRAILFDVGRVIIRVDLSRAMEALGRVGGLSHVQVLRELETDPRWHEWQEGRISPREFHKHLSRKLNFSYDFEEFCTIWNSILEPETILPDALFEQLAIKCRLALLSNTDPMSRILKPLTRSYALSTSAFTPAASAQASLPR
jgi:FMN phosphatase YigB (HAD superfamily)